MPIAERQGIYAGTKVYGRNVIVAGFVRRGPVEGVVISVFASGALASVRFSLPATPMVCAACGSSAHLSMNGATGEIECMRSHCGHSHGFEDHLVASCPIEKLEVVPNDAEIARRNEWREKLKLRRREVEWANNALKDVLEEGRKNGWKE